MSFDVKNAVKHDPNLHDAIGSALHTEDDAKIDQTVSELVDAAIIVHDRGPDDLSGSTNFDRARDFLDAHDLGGAEDSIIAAFDVASRDAWDEAIPRSGETPSEYDMYS
jgi:hypothetical protein